MDEPPSNYLADFLLGDNLLYIFFTVLLLLLAGIISAVEAALFSLKPEDVEAFRNSKNKNGKVIAELLSNPKLLLSGLTAWQYIMLICTATFFTISISFTETAVLLVEIAVLSIAFAFLGVIIPKVYGTAHSVSISKRFAGICSRLIRIVKPVIEPLLKMSFKVERKLEEIAEENSVKELTQALELAAAEKQTSSEQKEILQGIVNFGTLTVKQVMRPSNEINSVDVSLNFHDLLIYIKKSGFSRIPVYRDTIDQIEGILYIKDLLPFLDRNKNFDWLKFLRPAYFVPETKKIDILLKEFQEKRVHIALALNERNDVSGVITLEDIIEEIIGDIHDEFDEVGAYYKKIDEKTFVVDSKIPVHEFYRILDVESPAEERGENETLGAMLSELQNELPKIGDQIVLDPFTFVIEAVDHKRIKKIRVHIHEENTN